MNKYYKIIPDIVKAVQETKLKLKDFFYNSTNSEKIYNELRNTEVDLVIFTDKKIYLGEAKRKEKLGFNGKNILPHQLIRQRIMVEILKYLKGDNRRVISFIVCDKSRIRSMRRAEQVKALTYLDNTEPVIVSWQDFLETIFVCPEQQSLKCEVEKILSILTFPSLMDT